MSIWRTRPLESKEVIYAGADVVANNHGMAKPHLRTGLVIERDDQIAAVLRGHTLIYFHDEHGVTTEIVGSADDAVARMKFLIDNIPEVTQ